MPVPSGIVASSTSRAGDPVDDLVQRAVAADRDDERLRRRRPRRRASSIRCPGRSEKSVSPCRPSSAARCASSGQRLPVAPLPDAGLTRKTVPALIGRSRRRARSRVIRSTAARSSSSVIRVNSPSTTMSLTVSRQPASTPRSARDGEERRRLHLDREDAALRPALVLAVVGVVEDVARDDRADVQRLARAPSPRARRRGRAPGRGRAVRLVADEVHRRRVGGHGGQRDDQVAERVVRLQAAAGADAHQLLAAELHELLEDDRRARAAHARSLHRDRLALPGARVAEQAALGVPLDDVVE